MEDNDKQKKTGSVIAESMAITGEVVFQGTLEIKGTLEGVLHGTRAQVSRTGRLDGDISLEELECLGNVNGVIRADSLIIRSSAHVSGSLSAKQLQMDPGAIFDGEVRISNDSRPELGKNDQKSRPNYSGPTSEISVVEGRGQQEEELEIADSILESLSAAVTGGSELVVVVSDKEEDLSSLSQNLQERLKDRFLVLSVIDPAGSFRELLIRISKGIGAALSDYSDQEQVLADLTSFLKKHKAAGKHSLLLIEHGEQMYPATLERIIQRLAGQQGTEMALTQMVLFGGTTLKSMVDDDSRLLVREPDCVFEL